MSEFVNREAIRKNLKLLKVKNVTRVDGQLKEMLVDVERLDEPSSNGTALNSEDFKKIIGDKISSKIKSREEIANEIFNKVQFPVEAYVSFTLPNTDEISWSLADEFTDVVSLNDNFVQFRYVREDTELSFIGTVNVNGVSFSKEFNVLIKRQNPNYVLGLSDLEWIQKKGELQSTSLIISSSASQSLYVDIINYSRGLEITAPDLGATKIKVEIKETAANNMITSVGSLRFYFLIKVYSDEEKQNCIGEIADCVNYYPVFEVETDKTEDYWIQSSTNMYSNTFRITSANGEPIYVKVLSENTNDNIKVRNILGNGTEQVVINVEEDISFDAIESLDWVTVSQNFVVGVYIDENFTELVKEITYTVHYTFKSGDPYIETLYSLNGTELYLSGELRTSSFFLATENEEKLYARVLNKSDDTSVSFEDNGTTVVRVNVTISPIEGANVTTTYEVTIEVFNSDSYTTKLGEITLVVYYSPNSTDPID